MNLGRIFNCFSLDNIGMILSFLACSGSEEGAVAVLLSCLLFPLAPLLTAVPHHVVRSCCDMLHTAVLALGVKMCDTSCRDWQFLSN